MSKFIDVTGQKFGMLTALEYKGDKIWLFRCDCGEEKLMNIGNVKSGKSRSCGCYQKEVSRKSCAKLSYKHGLSNHALFRTWEAMKDRCTNKNNKRYKHYGGRGIGFCEEWKDFMNFYSWAIEAGYKKGLTLDRIDVNGNYEPGNCRWVTLEEQAGNKRNNVMITYNGITKDAQQWSLLIGRSPSFLAAKVKGKTGDEKDRIAAEYIERAGDEMLRDGEMGNWISVEEKLPENGQRVLVCGVHGAMDVCRYEDVNGKKRFVTHESQHLSISYWMPLPKVPARVGATYKNKM